MMRRTAIVGGALATAVVVTGAPANAAWRAPALAARGYTHAATVLTAGTPVANVPVGSGSVAVSWPKSLLSGGGAVTGYRLTRADVLGGTSVAAASGCGGVVTTLSCTETNVPDGVWQYTVRAVRGTNWSGPSGAAGAQVVVSTTPSAPAVSFPAGSGVYGVASWAGAITGTVATSPGVTVSSVRISVRRTSTGLYYNPTSGAFTSSSETQFAVTSGTSAWTATFDVSRFTASGQYTVKATAVDSLGRTSTSSSAFTVYPTAPPAPSITSGSNGTFTFTDAQSGVTFECAVDGAAYAACGSPASYPSAAVGSHTFAVRAKDPGGNVSTASTQGWTVEAFATDIQSRNGTGTAGRLDAGDTLTFSFDAAVAPSSVLTGWSGASTAVTVRVTKGSHDSITVTGTNLGTVDLGRSGYVSNNSVAFAGTMVRAGNQIVLTLGTQTGGNVATVPTAATMTWTVGSSLTDTTGTKLANVGTTVTESGTADIDF